MNWPAFTHAGLKLLGVVALVGLNAFFVAAELALVRIRDTQLAPLAERGNRRARRVRYILAHLDAYISATQFGITLASMALGVMIEPVFRALLEPAFVGLQINNPHTQRTVSIVLGFFVNCYLLIIAGELVPKAIALRRTLPTALWISGPLRFFYQVSFPFIWLFHRSSQFIIRRLGFTAAELREDPSEEELRLVLATSPGTGERRTLVLNALDFRHRTAREIMRPRAEIQAFNTTASLADCLALAEKTRYSRFPLSVDGQLDRFLGVVHIKDLYALRQLARTAADLQPAARKLLYIPETAALDRLLRGFLDRRLHMAVVVDEYGSTVGIVTLENVLEALVGQIQDEFDTETSQATRVGDNAWLIAGTLPLHELEQIIGSVVHDENTATASGWVTGLLGGFPRVNDQVQVNGFELRVERMNGPRVEQLRVTKNG